MKNLVCICLLLLSYACSKKESATTPDFGTSYFPTTAGHFCIYDVDSTVYSEIPRDTFLYSYQLKERIADSYLESDGGTAIRLERFVRTKADSSASNFGPWRVLDVQIIRASNSKIEIQESNERFTRLVFPIKENTTWDGNAANTKAEQFFVCTSADQSQKIGSTTFEKTVDISELDKVNLIEAEQAFRTYAAGVGLVQRKYVSIKGNSIEPGTTVFQRIEKGWIYNQKFSSQGNE